MMAMRRTHSTRAPRFWRWRASVRLSRHSSGITRSLLTMVASATDATITMPVAAEKPPTYAASASAVLPCASGSASTKVSGAAPVPASANCPAAVIGSTRTQMITR